MKLKNKLKALGLAGLLALSSCAALPKPFPAFNDYKGQILYLQQQDKIMIGYDTDGDRKEDLRYVYQFKGYNNQGQAYFELVWIWSDDNKNGEIDEDEIRRRITKPRESTNL